MEQTLWLAAHRFSFWHWKLEGTVKKITLYMKLVRCSKSKCWLIFAKILEPRLPVSLCHDHPFMSHDVREEVWDWLFKAAIKWKLPHERPRNSFCEAAIISELVSTTNSTSDFFHMWNIQSLESHCIKQDLIQAHISIFSGSEAWQIMWMAPLGDLCWGTHHVADHKGQIKSAMSEQH